MFSYFVVVVKLTHMQVWATISCMNTITFKNLFFFTHLGHLTLHIFVHTFPISVAPILDARLGISDPIPMLMLPGPPTDISAIIFFIMPSMSIDRDPMLPPEPIDGKSEAKKKGNLFT